MDGAEIACVRHPHGVLVVRPLAGADRSALLEAERVLFDQLPEPRRPSWLAGRLALARALVEVGAPREPIFTDPRGAPVLPAGFTGSITHKPQVAAAVASAFAGAHLGVDVEILERPRADIGKRVLTERERAAAGEDAVELMARFSLKEAIYKAVDRYVGRYVGFLEAEIPALPPAADAASWAEARFVEVEASLLMAKGEGPFVVEATWARVGKVAISTARIRPR